jgi:hypothetical protein
MTVFDVGEDSFHSLAPVVTNELQFKGLNLIQKLDDRVKKLINIIEFTTCKRCFDMGEKPEVGWCQVRTAWRMRTIAKEFSSNSCFGAFEE